MSATPVSIDSPPAARIRTGSEQERDLQAKMQHLISLQYQEQEHHYDDFSGGTPSSGMASANRKSFFSRGSRQQNLHSLGMTEEQPQQHPPLERTSSSFDDSLDEVVHAPHSSSRDSLNPQAIYSPDVGKGTIVFSEKFQNLTKNKSSSSSNSSPSKGHLQQQQEQLQKLQQHLSPHFQHSSTTRGSTSSKPPSSQQASHAPPNHIYAGYGSVQQPHPQKDHQQHEFHYGNPDFHDPYDKTNSPAKDMLLHDDNDDVDGNFDDRRQARTCCCERICCLYRPIVNLFRQENLHRSFCYGAIDGLLTGSGIVSAFWGLGVLSVRTSWEIRLAVLALAMAACVADSLCMALGHIWTTYIVTSNHEEERSRERLLLETNKSQSKGKLVDMLLARGVLKIDAMSLADTLEGYPDLLVSALVGDSLLAGGENGAEDEHTEDGFSHLQGYQIDTTSLSSQQQLPSHPRSNDPTTTAGGGLFGSFGSWKFQSYGQFHPGSFDSDSRYTRAMCRESQMEGLFMMTGFSMFAGVPSLLWLLLPIFFQNPEGEASTNHNKVGSSTVTSASTGASPMVGLPSLIIFILSAIVWCLGVWKSRFVDSNWVIFGMETIAVLLVCIFSAYCVAMLMALCLGFETSQNHKLLPSEFSFRDL